MIAKPVPAWESEEAPGGEEECPPPGAPHPVVLTIIGRSVARFYIHPPLPHFWAGTKAHPQKAAAPVSTSQFVEKATPGYLCSLEPMELVITRVPMANGTMSGGGYHHSQWHLNIFLNTQNGHAGWRILKGVI